LCTRVVIARRISTDLVVLLEEGVAVEQGSHSDLIGLNGQYAASIPTGTTGAVDYRQGRSKMLADHRIVSYSILGVIRCGIVATKEGQKGENTCQLIAELLTSNQVRSK
jgi:hypothetical protein